MTGYALGAQRKVALVHLLSPQSAHAILSPNGHSKKTRVARLKRTCAFEAQCTCSILMRPCDLRRRRLGSTSSLAQNHARESQDSLGDSWKKMTTLSKL